MGDARDGRALPAAGGADPFKIFEEFFKDFNGGPRTFHFNTGFGQQEHAHAHRSDVMPAGTQVMVKGLRNDRQMNDAQGQIQDYDGERYTVMVQTNGPFGPQVGAVRLDATHLCASPASPPRPSSGDAEPVRGCHAQAAGRVRGGTGGVGEPARAERPARSGVRFRQPPRPLHHRCQRAARGAAGSECHHPLRNPRDGDGAGHRDAVQWPVGDDPRL